MGKTHKKAVWLAMLLAAALAGMFFALFPTWEQHRAEEKQEAMLTRLEITVSEKEADLQTEEIDLSKELEEAVALVADISALMDAVQETTVKQEMGKKPETAEEAETEKIPETEEETETVITPETEMPQAGAEIGILSIPKIDARLPVTAGVSEEQLKVSEGWVMQTAMIGSTGNAVIAGHRSYTYGKHFNRLGEIETGDEMFFAMADGVEMRFIVSEILTVLPDDPAVFDTPPEGIAQLTLYTCTPVKVATHRLLVRAFRVEE